MERSAAALLAALIAALPVRAAEAPAPLSAPPEPAAITGEMLQQAAAAFYDVDLDPSRVYPIARARLQRDRLAVELEGGALVLARPILGRVTGACYRGRARLHLTPPTPSERATLKERIGEERFQAETTALYLRFYDYTVSDLTAGIEPSLERAALKECGKIFSARNDIVRKYEERTIGTPFNLELDFLEDVLSPARAHDFFLLEAEVPRHGWITYLQRPGRNPQAALLRILKPGHHGSLFDTEFWAACSLGKTCPHPSAETPGADILHNQMEIVIPNRVEFTIDALITWRAPVDQRSARFAIINNYRGTTWNDDFGKPVLIESVSDEAGSSLPFVHRRHELLVRLPAPVAAGSTSRLRVRAREKTIWQITPESYGLLNTYPWFPQESVYLGGRYTFDWTVKVRQPMVSVGSGLTVRRWEEKESRLNCVRLTSDTPLTFPSLIFGTMRETADEYLPPGRSGPVAVRLHWLPEITLSDMSAGEYSYVASAGPASDIYRVPASKPPEIVREARTILGFFERVLGPYPNSELDIAQMGPGLWFGQAPPGLVQITSEYFLSQGLIGSFTIDPRAMDFIKNVLPHEIGHHYWGETVSWESEEDQWLSESLAEYSAGLYVQSSEGEKAFRQMMNSWRKDVDRWEGTLPIVHANRASGETAWAVRGALLYSKGPLVLHMLRTQVGDEPFFRILRKVLEDHRGRAVTTAEFQGAAEAVAGYEMEWFFDQWVRGAGIPELRFAYRVTPAEEGKFFLDAQLVQSDPATAKAFFLPVDIQFEGERRARKEWRVRDARAELRVLLPEKPVRVRIDEPGDLLAKIVYESGD